uniref:Uncharacterized protein n=1 Tax=Cyprinus carpio TaxID=7962 RepID=A0A8C2JS50_CYPCA
MSRKEIPDEIYRYWSAVASSLRLGWLGTNNVRTEMKACQLGLFPNLLNSSAVEEDILGLEEHLREGADIKSSHLYLYSALNKKDCAVELLISAGARLEKSSEELGVEMCCLAFLGDTEQMEAVCSDQPEMVKFCIRNGSDLEVWTHRDFEMQSFISQIFLDTFLANILE